MGGDREFPSPVAVDLGNGITASVHERGTGPAVVLCHGFPDLAFGWRHQIDAIGDWGFRAIAPDGRGYGATTAPPSWEDYSMTDLVGDVTALLDTLEIERAVLVGHDWGGWVVWGAAVLHPERVAGVVGVCTPYLAFPSVATHLELTGGDVERQYVAWFQEPGVAEEVMDLDVEAILRTVLRTGAPPEEVVATALADGRLNMNPFLWPDRFGGIGDPIGDEAVLRHYIDVFERTGFRGGINWYRNVDRNAREHPSIGSAPIDIPALMITAEWDHALTPELARGMRRRCSDLEVHLVERAGHWVHQEYPTEFNAILLDWLQRRFAPDD